MPATRPPPTVPATPTPNRSRSHDQAVAALKKGLDVHPIQLTKGDMEAIHDLRIPQHSQGEHQSSKQQEAPAKPTPKKAAPMPPAEPQQPLAMPAMRPPPTVPATP